MGLANIPKAKWATAGNQVGLKQDPIDWEESIIESFDQRRPPSLTWVDAGNIKVTASSDAPTKAMLNGFPNLWHPGQFLDAGLSDGKYRENTADASMALASVLWGTEKNSQWYAIYAISADGAATFSLKAMPLMRARADGSNAITTGLNVTPATVLDYGFSEDEFIDSYIYVLSGTKKGYLRPITANATSGGASQLTYSGTALSLTQGDWFIILPDTNFKFLGSVWNDSGGAISEFEQVGDRFYWPDGQLNLGGSGDVRAACPLATEFLASAADVVSPVTVGRILVSDMAVGWTLIVASGTPDSFDFFTTRTWVKLANCVYTSGGEISTQILSYGYAYPPGYLA